ncbi:MULTISPECIES: YveK family protein [unclassified Fusibacter]|uniref:YveK family protein n=1 Tax=unclassified Fusibacter TaxID=2624464 RepID=UPI00101156FC|nr:MULTISPECIES: Wzz/FepE/Etk N-terminal domain-containing protein [unclassified Fusibacter]MCK8059901.1 Wzz/FepE/Etk N-terminal domain-containing protein [Fusibacter sp. A2]NPE23890.1 capsular biosynthesis protein [Fusibacter sp. A1]RXV58482.1 capsular biosynthesis protein [Fusibacter sp. A1]
MEETIELRELIELIFHRKWLIVVITLIAIVAGTLYSFYGVTPLYKSNTTLMVNGSKGLSASDIAASFDISSIGANQKLVVTYSEIVKSRIVLEQVIARLELDYSFEVLNQMIVAVPVKNTEILNIVVTNKSDKEAAEIANTVSDVFMKEVMRIMKVNNVEIIDRAIPVDKPINVRKAMNVAIAAVLGLMSSVFLVFALEYLDNTLKSEEDVAKFIGVPVLGGIPLTDFTESN